MIPRFLCLVLLVVLFFSCKETEQVKVRDDQGNVVEKYARNKTDYAKHGTYIAFFRKEERRK